MDIVIDKSYLHGATTGEVLRLCQENKVLIPESLFYELLTTTPKKRVNCFRKFPDIENPVVLIPNVGTLLRFEVSNKIPCNPVTQLAISNGGKFNTKLRDEDFCLPLGKICRWIRKINGEIEDYKKRSAIIYYWFPSLEQYRLGQTDTEISAAEDSITNDEDFVRKIYEQIRKPNFPESHLIGPGWIIYRWMQINFLTAIDYLRRFGPNNTSVKNKRIENDYLDIEYCIIGAQVGALASNDYRMKNIFKKICPMVF